LRSRYGYSIICESNQFVFLLIPGNKGMQSIGKSRPYDSYEECLRSLKNFRDFVVNNNVRDASSPCVKFMDQMTGKSVQYIDNGVVVFETRTYAGGSVIKGCKTGIASIFNHINEYTGNRKV